MIGAVNNQAMNSLRNISVENVIEDSGDEIGYIFIYASTGKIRETRVIEYRFANLDKSENYIFMDHLQFVFTF